MKRKKVSKSLEMRELSQQIDSHVVVLDEDNPATTASTGTQGATQLVLGSDPQRLRHKLKDKARTTLKRKRVSKALK